MRRCAVAVFVFLPLFAAGAVARAENGKGETVVAAFGDSLTAGYGLAPGEGFAPVLQERLRLSGLSVTVINAGVSGDTSADGLARADWVMQDKPDIVIVELGANDMLRGLPVGAMKKNLDAIVARIQSGGARVLLAGMLAGENLGAQYQKEFRAAFAKIAEERGVLFYPFFLEGVAAVPELNLPDGKHPNAKGVRVIAENIAPFVEKLARAGGDGH